MKALVIYESMYGNTQEVASAAAAGILKHMEIELAEVGSAPTSVPPDIDLLVIGGPTHQFGMSRRSSRETAARDRAGGIVSAGIGLREWLEGSPSAPEHLVAATFCTVLQKPRFLRYVGTAARSYQKRLNRLGITTIAQPESFWVVNSTGPLADGEYERARQWGEQLGLRVTAAENARQIA